MVLALRGIAIVILERSECILRNLKELGLSRGSSLAICNWNCFHLTGGRLMTKNTWSRKFVAMVVAAAVLSVYSMLTLATTGSRSGELSVKGDVSVNGQKVTSGGTVFSGSAILPQKAAPPS